MSNGHKCKKFIMHHYHIGYILGYMSNGLISGKMVLFVSYSIDNIKQSQTVRSYMLAIKNVLLDDGVILNENRFLLSSLTELDQDYLCKMEYLKYYLLTLRIRSI